MDFLLMGAAAVMALVTFCLVFACEKLGARR